MSDETAGKAEWLARIERGRAAWEALVAGVDEDAMERPGVDGDWSFKDVTAHLNAWRAWTVARLDAAAGDGAAPSPPWPEGMGEETPEGVDEINQWFYARGRDRPAAEILAEAREQFQRIRVASRRCPKRRCQRAFPGWRATR